MKAALKQPVCVLSGRKTSSGSARARAIALAKPGSQGPNMLSFRHTQCPVRISAASPGRSSSRKTTTPYAAAATSETAAEKPEMDLAATLKLTVVNFYLNVFGGFEAGIKFLVDTMFPTKIKSIFAGLFASYKEQVTISMDGDAAKASSKTAAIFREMIRAYAGQLIGVPYQFPNYHTAIREGPIDYFKLGNDYVGTLINYDRSLLGNPHLWAQIEQQIAAKENVVLFANHQSEADAAFIPLLTQAAHPGLGEKVVYIAGDRVVSDLMSKPFSMGRNLLCINSKKHMAADDSKTKSKKMRQNMQTLKEMQKLMQEGGHIIWIAPSGGRDRRQADGTLFPDNFDPASVELMKKFAEKKGAKPTHFYPLAMATYDTMPPPTSVGGDLGEERVVTYCGCGLGLSEEVDITENGLWYTTMDEDVDSRTEGEIRAKYIYGKVMEQYAKIGDCMDNDREAFLPEGCVRPVKAWP
uniref:Phospholipid/glycerol acyltransferase domain-containing protein n=1 Tax=Pyramimonas obovata TaxID=1411642 RepID=A0A7S0RXK5_9CHLO|eukprot:CAMPEP_0118933028 /NCGR_PEP_ID=MMETSP1169-20130426/11032_1 /TAXON_ID=36882 /ORGANISM="Pyramimonas obovata, Strain CCMP722" /LENGTH=467 /DNA_ID=CAMNT_0006875747 /DNA_START=71 /DNA_END=1474 /DNA_ORIENTATION=-